MSTPFLVSVKCPECGGPLQYPEGAYTFKCPYCGSVLRIKKNGVDLKYIIPSRIPNKNELHLIIKKALCDKKAPSQREPEPMSINKINTIFKPFWYFKGMLYYNHASKTENDTLAKTWYYSFQANPDFAGTLSSLSVRAEVLTLQPYDKETIKRMGVALPLLLDKEQAFRYAESAADMSFQCEAGHALYKRLHFIGEHFFIIYYPVLQVICSGTNRDRTFLIDGIGKTLLEHKAGKAKTTPEGYKEEDFHHIELLSHRCKNCGYDLDAKDFDIVFYCNVCQRLWLLKNGEYHDLKIKVLDAKEHKNCVYIPFWRFEVHISSKEAGLDMKTIHDLSTFMKMGRFLLRNEDPERPIRLYVPALVTRNARALLKLATRINMHQRALPVSQNGNFPIDKILNASLTEDEAEEMLRVIVFSVIGRQDRKALDFYRDFTIDVTKKELLWYPFEDKGNFLVDNFHQYNFPKQSMDINVYS
ncbi:MAG: zinc finger domain-containing protein [bacterium]